MELLDVRNIDHLIWESDTEALARRNADHQQWDDHAALTFSTTL